MFYRILLILAFFNFYKYVKGFIKENVTVTDGKVAEISTGAYISLAAAAIFYIMVIAICCVPTILFGRITL